MNINATLIGQTIAFIIFVWFCVKYVWPPIIKVIEERQSQIANALASAEATKKSKQILKSCGTRTLSAKSTSSRDFRCCE